jgi:hypothetical protein
LYQRPAGQKDYQKSKGKRTPVWWVTMTSLLIFLLHEEEKALENLEEWG